MVLEYTPHLENRLKERRFPNDYPKKIFLKAEENYIDISQNSYIAIKKTLVRRERSKDNDRLPH